MMVDNRVAEAPAGERAAPVAGPLPAGHAGEPLRARLLWPCGIFVVSLVVYALCTQQILIYTNPPTGDQPFYLHTAISIVQDHDLNEYNNYAQEDEQQYYPRVRYPLDFQGILAPYPLPPHNGHTTNRPATEWYSKHGLGLSVLIVPGWVLGVSFTPPFVDLNELDLPTGGWPMVVLEMEVLGALLAVQVFLLAYETTRRRGIALSVWAALAFSNPLMTYSFLIFPELPAGLCAVYAFRRLALGWQSNGPLRLLLIGACIGFLPWLHARFLPIAGGLALFALWTWLRSRRDAAPAAAGAGSAPEGEPGAIPAPFRPSLGRLILAAAPAVLSLALLAAYYYWLYGTVLPNTGDHAGFIDPRSDPFGLPVAILGLFFDQQWGLLMAAPIYILAFVGLAACWGAPRKRQLAIWLLIIAVPYFLLVAEYRQWWGEWCPPARYLATLAPLLALPLAQSLLVLARRVAYVAFYHILAFAGWLVMIGLIAHPHSMWNQPNGKSDLFTWLNSLVHVDLVPHLPAIVLWSWDHHYPMRWDLLFAWTGVAVIVVVAGLLMLRETRAAITRRLAFRHYRPTDS